MEEKSGPGNKEAEGIMGLKEHLQNLEILVNRHSALCDFEGGISKAHLEMMEKELGFYFPVSYCWFLLTYGVGFFGDTELFGLKETADGEICRGKSIPDVAWTTNFFRQRAGIPENCFVLCGSGDGIYYCVEADKERQQADGRVFAVCLDEGYRQENVGKGDILLSTFLKDCFEQEIEEAAGYEKT